MIDIAKTLDEKTEKNIKRLERTRNHAHDAGWTDDCKRHLVLLRTQPEKLELHGLEMQRIFDEGKRQEVIIAAELEEAGFKLKKPERFIWEELELEGEIEYLISEDDKNWFPIDFKTCSPNIYNEISRCKEGGELLSSRHLWIRHYPAQNYLYTVRYKFDVGLILFKEKNKARKHQINCPLEMKYVDRVLDGLDEVNTHVKKDTLPDPVRVDACSRCGFMTTVCFPDSTEAGENVRVYGDAELEIKLQKRQALIDAGIKDKAKELEALDKEIKGEFKNEIYVGQELLIGDFTIKIGSYERSTVDLPQEVKEKYQRSMTVFRIGIKNLTGAM
ncbi:MAG: hypothetical protein E3J76_02825 [Candidatus Aminicenantes bacterium]|nr:MAG: hypothetical protein E3J76_02825 [Candidatus Aminicenantes bacterium]